MAPSPLPPCEDTGNGPSTNTDSFSTLTWIFPASRTRRDKFPSFLSCPGSGLCENSLDGHRPGKLTQDLTARIPNSFSLPNTPPPPGEDVPAVLLTALLPPPSTPELLLFLQQRTGSSSQPPHICPTCRPQGTARPAPGTGNLPTSVKASSCHFCFHLVLPTLYGNSLNRDSDELSQASVLTSSM